MKELLKFIIKYENTIIHWWRRNRWFFKKIKNKSYTSNKTFLDYFETFIKKRAFNDRKWNYHGYLHNDNDINKYYFNNNMIESINRTKFTKKIFVYIHG